MLKEWRPVPEYEGTYEVSNFGDVRRLGGTPWCPVTRERKLVPRGGYLQVLLSKENVVQLHWVHRLVARAFLGEPSKDRPHVNHINGIRNDNRVTNLEWANHSENAKHAYKIGLRTSSPNPGEKNGNASFKDSDIPVIRSRAANGESMAAIGRDYGASRFVIWSIVRRKSWANIE